MNKHLLWTGLLAATLFGCTGSIDSSSDPQSLRFRDPSLFSRVVRRPRLEMSPLPVPDAGVGMPTGDAGPDPIPTPDAGPPAMPGTDAGTPPIATPDAGTPPVATPDAGPPPSTCVGAGCTCVRATELWRDGFESGYSNWTDRNYFDHWGDGCQNNALTTVHPHSGSYAQRNEIVCASSSPDGVHRGYGGLQWRGATVLPAYDNSGTGLDAPNGIVTTFWTWLEPGYSFGSGRWMSLFTINPTCDYTQRVVTLGIDNADGVLRAAHYWPEGTLTIEPGAPPFPTGRWVRVTVYMNLYSGDMHVWQDGRSIEHVSGIARASHFMCQWHWGLYASGDNTDVVMYEDDKVVWRMDQPWTDWSREPYLGETQSVCP